MPGAPTTLKAKALACIAQREHSRVELRRKLLAHIDKQQRRADGAAGIAPDDALSPEQAVDELLDWLVAKDLLSTSRFVETRIQARASRFGNLRIRHELAQHGVELDVVAVADLKRSEVTRARAVWVKRFGSVAADAAGRAKQMRFLAARGFSAEVVRRVVAGDDAELET